MSPLGCEYPNSTSIKYHAHILVSYFRIYVYLPGTLASTAAVNPFGLPTFLPIKMTTNTEDTANILPVKVIAENIAKFLWLPAPELNLLLCMIFLWSVTSPPSPNSDDNITIW